MATFDWPQILTIAAGSGVTAGIVNNLAGGIRDRFQRTGAASAAAAQQAEERQVRREVAQDAAREKNLAAAIYTIVWVEQEIIDLSTTEVGDPINYQTAQDHVGDAWGAADALKSVSHHHPVRSVRTAANKLALEFEHEGLLSAAGSHESERASKQQFETWHRELEQLIDLIHVADAPGGGGG